MRKEKMREEKEDMKSNNVAWQARKIMLSVYVDDVEVWPCSGLPIQPRSMKFIIKAHGVRLDSAGESCADRF